MPCIVLLPFRNTNVKKNKKLKGNGRPSQIKPEQIKQNISNENKILPISHPLPYSSSLSQPQHAILQSIHATPACLCNTRTTVIYQIQSIAISPLYITSYQSHCYFLPLFLFPINPKSYLFCHLPPWSWPSPRPRTCIRSDKRTHLIRCIVWSIVYARR